MTGEPQILGRQPAVARITPSGINPWYGSIVGGERVAGFIQGGARFTAEQDRELARRGIDPRGVKALTVRRRVTMSEAWWPRDSAPPLLAFECPVIGQRGDRIMVVTPAGVSKLVQPDGWAGTAKGRRS